MRQLHVNRSLLVVACLSCVLMLPGGLEAQSTSGPAPQTHFDSQLSVDDFHQLIGAMESHYSELD
jgi:hypothetical protein